MTEAAKYLLKAFGGLVYLVLLGFAVVWMLTGGSATGPLARLEGPLADPLPGCESNGCRRARYQAPAEEARLARERLEWHQGVIRQFDGR